jgi:hypothetical protein
MSVAVVQQFAFLHSVTCQNIPVRGERESCVYFTPWDFGKRMESDVVKSNTQRIDEILIQSASSKGEALAVSTRGQGTPYTSDGGKQDGEQHGP